MGQHAERLRQPPLREGVGGIALVVDREGAFKPLVHQVGVELCHLLGQHHAFVDDRPARQRRQIQRRHLRGGGGFLDAAADDIEVAFEFLFLDAFRIRDQNLLNLRPRRVRLIPKAGDVHWHMPPAVDVVAHAQHFGLDDRAAGFLRAKVGARQEDLAHGQQLVAARLVAGAFHLVVEEVDRDLHMDARAVASFAVSVDCATVPNGLQRVDAVLDHFAGLLAVDGHHKAHAAGGMFILVAVQRILRHPAAFLFLLGHPVLVILGHVEGSSLGK